MKLNKLKKWKMNKAHGKQQSGYEIQQSQRHNYNFGPTQYTPRSQLSKTVEELLDYPNHTPIIRFINCHMDVQSYQH